MLNRRILPWAGVCLLAIGCDIPTEAPIIEQRWVLPLEEIILDQSELLPPDVVVAGANYDVNIAPVSASESLGTLCPACAAANGTTVPAPAFSGSFSSTDALPSDVLDATVVGGSIDLAIQNGLDFDPIAGGGTMTITVAGAGGGPVLGTLTLDGSVDALPGNATTTRTITLGSGAIDGTETTVDIVSPGGQTTTMDTSSQIVLTATVPSMLVSTATIAVNGLSASLSEESLDAEDLDQSLIDGIQNGSAILDVTNPFGVTFDGTITVGTVTKTVSVPATATSTVSVDFTGAELRSFLGQPGVTFSGSGTIGGGPATVTPDLELTIDTTIDLSIEIGG